MSIEITARVDYVEQIAEQKGLSSFEGTTMGHGGLYNLAALSVDSANVFSGYIRDDGVKAVGVLRREDCRNGQAKTTADWTITVRDDAGAVYKADSLVLVQVGAAVRAILTGHLPGTDSKCRASVDLPDAVVPLADYPGFPDVAGSGFEADIKWAVLRGLFGGHGDGHFGPDEAITRGQAAKVLHRALEG